MESQGLETSWTAENELGCKGVGFLYAFAVYLSSFILISIILDRYWAFMRPLDAYPAVDRARAMALVAYIAGILVSLPEVGKFRNCSPFAFGNLRKLINRKTYCCYYLLFRQNSITWRRIHLIQAPKCVRPTAHGDLWNLS